MELCQWVRVGDGCVSFWNLVIYSPPVTPILELEWLSWKASVKSEFGSLWTSWELAQINT